tara:strand:- start:230 stop:559 length:330 start_codon:yes stop_codon:yes gene_type:complete
MNKGNILEMINYLSLILVLSYLFSHNIYAVFTGLILALISINIQIIANLQKFIFKKIKLIIKSKRKIIKKDEKTINVQSSDTKTLSLVEVIEESGYIPSPTKEDESNAA